MKDVGLRLKKSNDILFNISNNRFLIYPIFSYIAGIVLGIASVLKINIKEFQDIKVLLHNNASDSILKCIYNKLAIYEVVFILIIIIGFSAFGHYIVTLIPLILGFVISFYSSLYYNLYSVKGFGYSLIMIAPESSIFVTLVVFTIAKSIQLSTSINTYIRKEKVKEEPNYKCYLKIFLLQELLLILVATINSCLTYFLYSVINF